MRVLVLLLLMVVNLAVAEIYKTVDKDGRVIYTDSPTTENAEKIQLRELNTVPGAEPLPISTGVDGFDVKTANIVYQIAIISPRSDVTIPAGQRDLAIAVSLDEPLHNSHLLVYFMNGEMLEETSQNTIIVKDVPRGSHTLVVEAIDESGRSLGTSPPVVVNVIRPIAK